MERGVCPIVVLYFAVIRFSLTLKNVVGQQGYKFYHSIISSPFWVTWCHRSHDQKIRSGWFHI